MNSSDKPRGNRGTWIGTAIVAGIIFVVAIMPIFGSALDRRADRQAIVDAERAADKYPRATVTESARDPFVSPSPVQSRPSTGAVVLPGESDVEDQDFDGIPFRVPIPSDWGCVILGDDLGGPRFACLDSDEPTDFDNRVRVIWRSCPDGCSADVRARYTVDWQVAWFDEVVRMTAEGPDTATRESSAGGQYVYVLSRFVDRGGQMFHYAVVVDGQTSSKPLLRTIADIVRSRAG